MYEHSQRFREGVSAKARAAWEVKTVVYEVPTKEESTPYAIVLAAVEHEPDGAVHVEATYRFGIIGRFKKPTGSGLVLVTVKEAHLRTLAALLIAEPNFETVGYLPRIVATEYEELDSPDKPYFEVGLEFEVKAQELARGDLAAFTVPEP